MIYENHANERAGVTHESLFARHIRPICFNFVEYLSLYYKTFTRWKNSVGPQNENFTWLGPYTFDPCAKSPEKSFRVIELFIWCHVITGRKIPKLPLIMGTVKHTHTLSFSLLPPAPPPSSPLSYPHPSHPRLAYISIPIRSIHTNPKPSPSS